MKLPQTLSTKNHKWKMKLNLDENTGSKSSFSVQSLSSSSLGLCPFITPTRCCFIFLYFFLDSNHLLQLLPFLPFKPHSSQLQSHWQFSLRNVRDSLFSWQSLQNFTRINVVCRAWDKTLQNSCICIVFISSFSTSIGASQQTEWSKGLPCSVFWLGGC